MSKDNENKNENEYGGGQIKVLKGLEPVRKRPGMYIGSTDSRGLHHLIWEIVDNAVDEALAGHCTEITVEVDDKNVVTVTDNGRGVPTGIHAEEKIPVIDVLFTMLHAGGKFGGEESGYKVSGGLHGVGASVTNALSEWLHVEVRRDKEVWQAQYKEGGKPSKKTQRVGAMKKSDVRGTTVSWFADELIFKDGIKYDLPTIEQRLREKAFLVRGLKFILKFPGHEDKVFFSKKGIAEMVEILNREREAVAPVIFLSSDTYENEEFETEVPVELAMQWTKSSDERIFSYANVVSTTDGGTHVSGLSAAITACLNKFAWDSNKLKKDKKQSFDRRDIFDGLTAAIAVKIEDPQFEGQTKGKLNNPEARTAAQTFVYAALTDWLNDKANQRAAKAILDRCLLSREIRIAKNNASKKIRNQATSIFADSNLPGKLADCLDVMPVEEREIFVVEGDSAAGSAKKARDSSYQAILPIRGKILNTLVAGTSKALGGSSESKGKMTEIEGILVALGGRKVSAGRQIVASLNADEQRYGKIIIMCDADVDGSHIAMLLLTMFHEMFPQLLREGRIFVAKPPLYKIQLDSRGEKYIYAYSDTERNDLLKKHKRSGEDVSRFKGLGEMNANDLSETCFEPATRSLMQVSIEDWAEIAEAMNLLMGNKAELRREWLAEVGIETEID